MSTISQEIPQPSITKISLKSTYLKFHSNFPGANELMNGSLETQIPDSVLSPERGPAVWPGVHPESSVWRPPRHWCPGCHPHRHCWGGAPVGAPGPHVPEIKQWCSVNFIYGLYKMAFLLKIHENKRIPIFWFWHVHFAMFAKNTNLDPFHEEFSNIIKIQWKIGLCWRTASARPCYRQTDCQKPF